MTALMKAVHDNDEARIKTLIAGGANVDELDTNGDAPLVMPLTGSDAPFTHAS